MIDVPDPPLGSAIGMRPLAEGIRLRWPAQPLKHRVKWLTLLVVLLHAAALPVVAGITNPGNMQPVARVSLFVLSAVILAGAMVCLRYHDLAFEKLTVRPDFLVYRQPIKVAESIEMLTAYELPTVWDAVTLKHLLTLLLGRGRRLELPKEDIQRIGTEGRGRYAHVVVEIKRAELPMGRFLSDADRRWLASVLRRWLEAPSDAPADNEA